MLGKEDYAAIWEPLGAYFRKMLAALQKEYPDLKATIHWHQNDSFPFIGYSSLFPKGFGSGDEDEDCVLTMEMVHSRSRNLLVVSSDISADSGEVLALGPSFEIDEEEDDSIKMNFLRETEKEVEKFFTDNLNVIRLALLKTCGY